MTERATPKARRPDAGSDTHTQRQVMVIRERLITIEAVAQLNGIAAWHSQRLAAIQAARAG